MAEESATEAQAALFLLDLDEFEYYFQFHRARPEEPVVVIVCFCVTSSNREIASAIAEGAHTVDQIAERCGAGTGCGSCRDFIAEMIEAAGAECPGKGRCSECPRSGGKGHEPRYDHPSRHAA
jgi:bacterioferritin-associated ferredoxin